MKSRLWCSPGQLVMLMLARWINRHQQAVIMDLKSRQVEVAGIVHEAYEKWMLQVLHNLTDVVDGLVDQVRRPDPRIHRTFRSANLARAYETDFCQ